MFRRSFRVAPIAVLASVACLAALSGFAASRPVVSAEAQTEKYFESIKKDPNLLVAFLLKMPKGGDLHNHLSGAIYAETFLQQGAVSHLCIDNRSLAFAAPAAGSCGSGESEAAN